MKILFLDTNIFIQCRDLSQLPWYDLFPNDEHLQLLITRTVQEEIDHFKQQGNNRRAKRAKKANSIFREILLSKTETIVLRESGPLVEISFLPPLSADCQFPAFLDLSKKDDMIISEMIKYKHSFPEHDISILTHDIGPSLTAKRCMLPFYIVPDDWLLPPEPDSKDKRILQLERRIKNLEENFPIIKGSFIDENFIKINYLTLEIIKYKNLEKKEIEELMKVVKKRFPMETKFENAPQNNINKSSTILSEKVLHLAVGDRYVPPSVDEIAEYTNETYPAWLNKVKDFFISLPKKIEIQNQSYYFALQIENTGNVPAENTVVELNARGDIFFAPPSANENQKDSKITFPSPPKPPKGKWKSIRDSFLDITNAYQSLHRPHVDMVHSILTSGLNRPLKRDKNEFYWKGGRPRKLEKCWSLGCDEFRHKIKDEIFDINIMIPPSIVENYKCRVEALISAKNLPAPISIAINIDIKFLESCIIDEAKKYIQRHL